MLGCAVVLVAFRVAGCQDSADSRTTARVSRIADAKACLVPEDPEQRDLEGCFPFRAEDGDDLTPGACVSVVVPNQLEAEKRDDPLRSVAVLGRRCER